MADEDTDMAARLQQRTRELELIHKTGASLTASLDIDTVNRALHDAISELMDCDSFLVSGYDATTHEIRALFILHDGEILDVAEFPPIPFDPADLTDTGGTQKAAIRSGESLLLNDYVAYIRDQTRYYYEAGEVHAADAVDEDDEDVETTRSALIVPLKLDARVTGVVQVFSYRQDAYTAAHLRFVEAIAPQAAIAIKNALLVAHLEERVTQRTAQLAAAQARTEAILESTTEAIILLRGDGLIDRVNRAFCRMLDVEPAEAIARSLAGFTRDGEPFTLQAGYQADRTMQREDGSTFNGELTFMPLQHTSQTGWVCTLRDTTRHKQLEDDLRAALEHERRMGELRLRLVSMVSHEFRTPLAVMLSSVSLLQHYADRLTADQHDEHLHRIESKILSLTAILEDTLSLSRMDEECPRIEPVPTDLVQLAQDVAQDMNTIASTNPITRHVTGPPTPIHCDPVQIRQVFTNLLSNAIKYSPTQQPVSFDLHFGADGVVCTVTDRGIGIPAEDQKLLFQPFHRASNATHVRGTGLGLVIVKRIVEAHGGSITLASQTDHGTTVTVRLWYLPPTPGTR